MAGRQPQDQVAGVADQPAGDGEAGYWSALGGHGFAGSASPCDHRPGRRSGQLVEFGRDERGWDPDGGGAAGPVVTGDGIQRGRPRPAVRLLQAAARVADDRDGPVQLGDAFTWTSGLAVVRMPGCG